MWNHNYFIYIITNSTKSTLYIGVTNDICTRLYQHKENKGTNKSFAGKYYCHYLVYYERFSHIEEAITRETEIKKWRRNKKLALIKELNPELRFLNNDVCG